MSDHRTIAGVPRHPTCAISALTLLLGVVPTGCNSFRNGWLDPTIVGNFEGTATLDIRTSLTLEDTPSAVFDAVYPTPEDTVVRPEEYPLAAGDTLAVEIYELRQRQTPYEAQLAVSSTGYVNVPVVGRVRAAGLTAPEFEDELRRSLRDRNVLLDPDLTVNPLFLQNATYSIFGIGVSAADNAPLRAGTFPIRRPDLRILEAINQVGGLNEFVSDVYVFRNDRPSWKKDRNDGSPHEPDAGPPLGELSPLDSSAEPDQPGAARSAPDKPGPSPQSETEELIAAATGVRQTAEPRKQAVPGDEAEEEFKALRPESPPPFIWDANKREFVPNPAHQPSRTAAEAPSSTTTADIATPTVNWARVAGDISYRVIRIPAEWLRSGDPMNNIIVRAGDVIRISSGEIGVYYVMGQVNRVGAFNFNAELITLKSAIAAAGGLSSLAWPDRCTIYRRIGAREQMIQVNLDRMFAGKEPDFQIRRGDIINVGTHPFAPFLQVIRAWTVPNPVNNVGYSFTYARNYADIDSFAVQQNPDNKPDRFPGLFP